MTTKTDGGPAFPAIEQWNEWSELKAEYVPRTGPRGGMSLRDYFAGQALGNSALMSQLWEVTNEHTAARVAYILADAMLKARQP
jgi:hypothetical protein